MYLFSAGLGRWLPSLFHDLFGVAGRNGRTVVKYNSEISIPSESETLRLAAAGSRFERV